MSTKCWSRQGNLAIDQVPQHWRGPRYVPGVHRDERLPLNDHCLFRVSTSRSGRIQILDRLRIKRAQRKGKMTKRKVKDATVTSADLVGLMKAR